MDVLQTTVAAIGRLDELAMTTTRERQQQTPPWARGGGRLDELGILLAGMTGSISPDLARRAVIVMAADHGVTAQGVSAYPQAVTEQMVRNFARGGAAINVLARACGADVVVVDVGVRGRFEVAGVQRRSLGDGTADFAMAPAMSRAVAVRAVETGIDVAAEVIAGGVKLLGTGDMGIGNTTSSSAVIAAITGASVEEVTGRGTGIDDATMERKIATIERALVRHRPDPADPLAVLAAVGGFEIGALAGVILGGAARRVPVLVDGFISGAAALVAAEICPRARDYMIAAHRSVERGHQIVLDRLELVPLLQLDMRLGEGTGAALAMPLVAAAVLLQRASDRPAVPAN